MQPIEFTFWIVLGLVSAGMLLSVSRRLDRDREILGALLVLVGGWYFAFGVTAGHGLDVLLPQILGGLFFAACGFAGLRYSVLYLSVGWVLHAAWDFGSPFFSDVSYMPRWTAPLCLGFDVLVGIYFFVMWRSGRSRPATT